MARVPSKRAASPAKATASAAQSAAKQMGVSAPTSSALAPLNPKAGSFIDSTKGGEPKLAWARSNIPWGVSGNGFGFTSISMGGRTARDAPLAAHVANEMATSNPIVATLLLNLTTQAIGNGLTLSSKPCADELGITAEEARALSHLIETKWRKWASSPIECDFTGRFDLHALAGAFYRSYLLNGEALAVLEWKKFANAKTRTKVQLLDYTQLDRSVTRIVEGGYNSFMGVCFTPEGRLAGYMLRPAPLGSFMITPMPQFVAAHTSWGRARVIHAMDFIDPRQVRGLSPIVASLTPAMEEVTLAEFALGKAMVETSFALTIESGLPTQAAFDGLQVNEKLGNTETWLSEREQYYSVAKVTPQVGTVTHLLPGDSLKFNESKTPNNNFDAFQKSLMRKGAKASGAAVEDVTGDYSQTSFSASRLAADLPHRINERRRRDIAERFYRGVYEAWLEEQIETGEIAAPANAKPFWEAKDAYCAGAFLGKGKVSPDELKTTTADVLAIENNLTTLSDVLAAKGLDLEATIEQIKYERQLLAEAGLSFPGIVATRIDTKEREPEREPDDDETLPGPARQVTPAQPTQRRKVKAFAVEHGTDTRGMATIEYVPPSRVRPIFEEDEGLSDEEILGV